MTTTDPAVFVSYSHHDARKAIQLAEEFRQSGVEVFLDRQRIGEDVDFETTIFRALQEEVTHLVVVATQNSLASSWVLYEIVIAERASVPVLAFLAEDGLDPESLVLASSEETADSTAGLLASMRASPSLPNRTAPRWNLRTYPSPHFVGRQRELDRIDGKLGAGSVAAVVGLGGIGKTQLVLQYAIRHAHRFNVVWWVRGHDRASIEADLAHLGVELGLVPPQHPNREDAVELALQWLRAHGDWLLIIDDLAGASDLDRLLFEHRGRVLVTSRVDEWGDRTAVHLDVLPAADAFRFLCHRTLAEPSESLERLAQRLGYLPLALAQAAAYIKQETSSPQEYLDLLQRESGATLGAGSLLETNARVASTWSVTHDRIENIAPEANALLRMLAFLAPHGLDSSYLPDSSGLEPWKLLARYSMIGLQEGRISVHPLVQEITRESVGTDDAYVERALSVIHAALPQYTEELSAWSAADDLLPHVNAVAAHAQDRYVSSLDLVAMLNNAGLFQYSLGAYEQARDAHQAALEAASDSLGPNHTGVAAILNNLGRDMRSLGETDEAIHLFRRADAVAVESYPREDVVTWKSNLAGAYEDKGQLAEAAELYRDVLDARQQLLGPAHELVGETLNNLGLAYFNAGTRSMEAAGLLRRAVEVRRGALGGTHPYVAESLDNLGLLLTRLEELPEGEQAHREALAILREQLPDGHRSIAVCLGNLAMCVSELGRNSEAARYLEEAVSMLDETAAPANSILGEMLVNLASCYHEDSRVSNDRALEVARRGLSILSKESNRARIANAEVLLGMIHLGAGETDAARAFIERALDTYHELGDVSSEEALRAALQLAGGPARQPPLAEPGISVKSCLEMGVEAQKARRLSEAEEWYLKAISVAEQQGLDEPSVPSMALGVLLGMQDRFVEAGQWQLRSIAANLSQGEQDRFLKNVGLFSLHHRSAPGSDRAELRRMWREAGLESYGDFSTN